MPTATASSRRLPGIRFEAQPPPPEAALPRMDIAGFVGFAATGPLDVPVVVEDMARFTEVFGEAAPLFWDQVTGEAVSAYLAPTVRAFFRNGGTRCWVVRVAGRRGRPPSGRWRGEPSQATGPSQVAEPSQVTGASRARFPVPGLVRIGDDGVAEQGELHARSAGSWADDLTVAAGLLLTPLEVVEAPVRAAGAATAEWVVRGGESVGVGDLVRVAYPQAGAQLLFTVAAVSPLGGARPGQERGLVTVTGTEPVWVVSSALGDVVPATVWLPGVEEPVEATVWDDREPGLVQVDLGTVAPLAPPAGTLLRFALERAQREPALLVLGQASGTAARSSPPGGSTVLHGRLLRLARAWPPEPSPPGRTSPMEVLAFELRARLGEERVFALGPLGFHPSHPRYAGALPSDEALYAELPTVEDPRPRPRPALWDEAASPRFPLAGAGGMLYPLGMDDAAGALRFVRAVPEQRRALARDGLAEFDTGLFLDAALADAGTDTLMETADFLRYRSEAPRDLVGIHALLGIDEVTLVAIPDATHRRWRPLQPAAPPPPGHEPFEQPAACGRGRPGFEDCRTTSLQAPYWQDLQSPPAGGVLVAAADRLGNVHLAWCPVAGAEAYVLEEAPGERSWRGAAQVYQGAAASVDLYGLPPGVHCYRVRAVAGGLSSDWSEGVTVVVARGEPWTTDFTGLLDPGSPPLSPDATLLAVHRALVRLCAARGDLLAVLSVPLHYHEDDVLDHVARLRSPQPLSGQGVAAAVLPLGGEERTLSFGAIYHPWLVTARADQPDELDAVPPDGAATGVLAQRSRRRGAWVAPANESVSCVVALVPAVAPAAYQRLQDGRVNTVRQEPRGTLWLSADTLADDPDLRQVSVRRLLSLLRRVALQHGPTYVFEPDDDAFRRRVRRGFEAILARLLTRGAFAGDTPDEAYRVAVADPPNTPRSRDQGQLIVELKVAPAIPMRFLTVRLVHSGDRVLTVEGA